MKTVPPRSKGVAVRRKKTPLIFGDVARMKTKEKPESCTSVSLLQLSYVDIVAFSLFSFKTS